MSKKWEGRLALVWPKRERQAFKRLSYHARAMAAIQHQQE